VKVFIAGSTANRFRGLNANFCHGVVVVHAVYIVGATRTPIGRHRGMLSQIRPDDLAAQVIRAAIARGAVPDAAVEQVILGCTNQAGEDNRNVARMAALLAGLPFAVAAHTVNRLCASGMQAVAEGARCIQTGDADVVVVGGVESMSRAPFVMGRAEEALPRAVPQLFDTSLGWRFANPRLAARIPLESMGETAENIAEKYRIGREEQDQFALTSHQRAAAARDAGNLDAECMEVLVDQGPQAATKSGKHDSATDKPSVAGSAQRDEGPRKDASVDALAKLRPAFRKGGSVTAGNSSTLSDGASALVLASEAALKRYNLTPRAQVVASACIGVDPSFMGEGPVYATPIALRRAGWVARDLDLVELNEAFAAQALHCIAALELNPAIVNVHGGAIAFGHPLGSSGSRILITLLHALEQRGLRRGMASLCVGVGQGMSMCIERLP
jgi:acetyl-CoA acetyltransferase family protein